MSEAKVSPRNMNTFLLIWTGELISIIGSGLTSFALGVWIYTQTGQATPFALTVLFGNLPRILLSPLAGSLADRWNRRWLMILADTGDALVTLAAFILLSLGNLQIWQIYLISLFNAAFASFQEPAYTASITMLVPKKDLARASGMVQMGQAAEMLVSPLLAGLLFLAIGLNGIIMVDFATFFFAIGALMLVKIPQPKISASEAGQRTQVVQDAVFGWNYLRARAGLFGLLCYFALVNFLLNFAAVLTVPLVLSFGTASMLGVVETVFGSGMLLGGLVMSAWGGPRHRIQGVIGFIALSAAGLFIAGLQPSPYWVGGGLFILMFCIPLASGPSQAIFQTKVSPEVQGRVFAIRSMISRSMMPLAFLIAGPLADIIFEPWMRAGGALANSIFGTLIGTGTGRGIGLLFTFSGMLLIAASILAYANPRIRLVEGELPDAIAEAETETPFEEIPTPETAAVNTAT
jgi:DHA3 family macrolide efflux protein-like MFS transporter